MADLPEWIKKLEHYKCDGQMELEDYLQENGKESGNYIHRLDFIGQLGHGRLKKFFAGNGCVIWMM
ncbi:MAG: hypothetical protein KHY39_14675 [Clostridiaceae bacterium]|nr:hypothetical protein [Clostridiaceae bacterium]